jgi:hypothetical protein
VRAFLEKVVRVSATLDESRLESAIGKLAEVLLPDELADARGALASDNLELRDRFVAQVPQLTSAEIGAQGGAEDQESVRDCGALEKGRRHLLGPTPWQGAFSGLSVS